VALLEHRHAARTRQVSDLAVHEVDKGGRQGFLPKRGTNFVDTLHAALRLLPVFDREAVHSQKLPRVVRDEPNPVVSACAAMSTSNGPIALPTRSSA
jgi:hypothetical protein